MDLQRYYQLGTFHLKETEDEVRSVSLKPAKVVHVASDMIGRWSSKTSVYTDMEEGKRELFIYIRLNVVKKPVNRWSVQSATRLTFETDTSQKEA